MKSVELGEVVLDIRPDFAQDNPRNSEGAFYSLPDGSLIFAYSRFKGKSGADWATSDICIIRSDDGGRSFGAPETILTCEGEDAVNIMSLSFLEMADGELGLFYLVRHTYTQLRMYLRRSADGGRTWKERVLCMPYDGFFVVNNDRVTRLADGRIVIPAARHATTEGYFDSRSDTVFFYSDDDGKTWAQSDTKCSISQSTYCKSGLQEPGILELYPGYLWGWARTDLGRQYEMFSHDNGVTWTAAEPSRFTGPCSPLSMKRDADNTIYAVWNPIPEYNGRTINEKFFDGGRSPFVLARSTDNARTFSEPIAFEVEEGRGYCYCAIHFTEDAMLLAYCAGGQEDGSCLARTVIRRVEKEQLTQVFAANEKEQ